MQKTSIEWVRNEDGTQGRSANPIRARRKDNGKVGWHCVMYSMGCARCYSAAINKRFGTGLPYNKASSDLVELFLDVRQLEAILKLKKPQRIFLCDMTDLFMDGVSDDDILKIWCVMEEASQHTFQILTKRPERMASWLCRYRQGMAWGRWPLPNVWLGTSVENQATADARIPHLLECPATVRFISAEPLLGPIDLRHIQSDIVEIDSLTGDHGVHRPLQGRSEKRIDWVIVGGESGPGARPMHPDWARSLRDKCVAAGTSYFFKQWGEFSPDQIIKVPFTPVRRGVPMDQPASMFRVGKKAAGRLLDGREWNQMPTYAEARS